MGIKIDELNLKYKKEDKDWDFSLFPAWLEKKGIPNTKDLPIVAATLEQVLIEFSPDNLPETHHEFDNLVLKMAVEARNKINQNLLSLLDKGVQASLKKYDEDWYSKGKFRKIWEVIRGKD
jgi:hypothetical protein